MLELNSIPDLNTKFRSNNFKRPVREGYSIYSLSTLSDLLTEIKNNRERPKIRFLVDNYGIAWFAREHGGIVSAPAHYQMTGEPQNEAYCKTAGNFEFADNTCRVLIKISNKSGDFRPSVDSLKWILAILILNEGSLTFTLPEILLVEEQNENGAESTSCFLNISDIRNWALHFLIPDPTNFHRIENQELFIAPVQEIDPTLNQIPYLTPADELFRMLTDQEHPTKKVYYSPSSVPNSHLLEHPSPLIPARIPPQYGFFNHPETSSTDALPYLGDLPSSTPIHIHRTIFD